MSLREKDKQKFAEAGGILDGKPDRIRMAEFCTRIFNHFPIPLLSPSHYSSSPPLPPLNVIDLHDPPAPGHYALHDHRWLFHPSPLPVQASNPASPGCRYSKGSAYSFIFSNTSPESDALPAVSPHLDHTTPHPLPFILQRLPAPTPTATAPEIYVKVLQKVDKACSCIPYKLSSPGLPLPSPPTDAHDTSSSGQSA